MGILSSGFQNYYHNRKKSPVPGLVEEPPQPEPNPQAATPGQNQFGIDPELYRQHVHPAMAVLSAQQPPDQRPQAEREKRNARLKLLGDAIRQTVQGVGATRGASVTPYDPSHALQSMQNYRQIMSDQAEAEQDYSLKRINKYLEGVEGARDEQMQRDRDQMEWEREWPYKKRQLSQEGQRIGVAEDREQRLQEQFEWNQQKHEQELQKAQGEKEKGIYADKNNIILDEENRNRAMFRLSDPERLKAEEMVLDELNTALAEGELDIDARTVQMLTNRSSITAADRWDLVQRWWHRLPRTRQFLMSGGMENYDPLGILPEGDSSPSQQQQQQHDPFSDYPEIDFNE